MKRETCTDSVFQSSTEGLKTQKGKNENQTILSIFIVQPNYTAVYLINDDITINNLRIL